MGFVIALAGFGLSLALALLGHPWAASIIGGTTLTGLVAVFVIGKMWGHKE